MPSNVTIIITKIIKIDGRRGRERVRNWSGGKEVGRSFLSFQRSQADPFSSGCLAGRRSCSGLWMTCQSKLGSSEAECLPSSGGAFLGKLPAARMEEKVGGGGSVLPAENCVLQISPHHGARGNALHKETALPWPLQLAFPFHFSTPGQAQEEARAAALPPSFHQVGWGKDWAVGSPMLQTIPPPRTLFLWDFLWDSLDGTRGMDCGELLPLPAPEAGRG